MSKPRQPGSRTAGDVVRSVGLVLGFSLLVLTLGPARELLFPSGTLAERVKVVEYSDKVAAARRVAPGAVLAPVGLPSSWRATSARIAVPGGAGVVELHVGFVTQQEEYAALEETTGAAGRFVPRLLGKKAERTGEVTIDGAAWQRWRSESGEAAFVRQAGRTTVIVTGSAPLDELRLLAGSLRHG